MKSSPTTRYRCVAAQAHLVGPLALISLLRLGVAVALGTALFVALMLSVLLRIGSDLTPDGVLVRRLRSRELIAWNAVREVRTRSSRGMGQRLELVCADGRAVLLPAPTSNTRGYVEALTRCRREVEQRSVRVG